MKKLSKIISSFLIITLCLSLVTPIYAADSTNTETSPSNHSNDSCQFTLSSATMSEEDRLYYENLMSNALTDGSIIVLNNNPFENLYIEVSDNNNNVMPLAYTGKVTSKTLTWFQYVLGIRHDLFTVTLTCIWFEDGDNSYISSFSGEYKVLSISASCSWDVDYNFTSNFLQTVGLDFTYNFGFGKGFILFGASLDEGNTSVTIEYEQI